MRIHLIAAARPNFMKIAPLYHELKRQDWANPVVVHTGQHYDLNMSDAFFQDLRLPDPDIHLGIGSGTHAEQTGQVMIAYERVLMEKRPDLVVVVGDVNSTMAATLAAVKLGVCTAHLEAGLRSFDWTMPEEINRVVTDRLANLLWTPSADADANLIKEGVEPARIKKVGNIMIDSLEMLRKTIENENACRDYGLPDGRYGIVTLHRPSNVDDPQILGLLCNALLRISDKIPLVFPVHPRTRKSMERTGLLEAMSNRPSLILTEPLNYIRFMNLVFHCGLAITDSGGIQEETTYMGRPCLTLRPNTERPVTVDIGTNILCNLDNVEAYVDAALQGKGKKGSVPELWDGHTAARVVQSIKDHLHF